MPTTKPRVHQQDGPHPRLHVLEDQVVRASRAGPAPGRSRNASTSSSRQSMPNGAWPSSRNVWRPAGAMSIVSADDAEVLHQVERVASASAGWCRSRASSGRGSVARAMPSRSHVLTATSSASVESSPPETPMFSGVPAGSCSIRLASPAHWMPKISAQRRCSSGPSARHERRPGHDPLQAGHLARRARTGSRRNGRGYCAAVVEAGRRSGGRPGASATSTSRVIQYESRRIGPPSPTRRDSASSLPFSAIRQWPPKTRSVVDSVGPAPA